MNTLRKLQLATASTVLSGSLLLNVISEKLGELQEDRTFPLAHSTISHQDFGMLDNWQRAFGDLITTVENTDLSVYDTVVLNYRDERESAFYFSSLTSENPYWQPRPMTDIAGVLRSLREQGVRVLNLNLIKNVRLAPEAAQYLSNFSGVSDLTNVLVNHTITYSNIHPHTNGISCISNHDYLLYVGSIPRVNISYYQVASEYPSNNITIQGAINIETARDEDLPQFQVYFPDGGLLQLDYSEESARDWTLPEEFMRRLLGM